MGRLFHKVDSNGKPAWFTPWDFQHALVGMFAGILTGMSFRANDHVAGWSILTGALVGHTVYEIQDVVKSHVKNVHDPTDTQNDSLENSMGDQIAFLIGFVGGVVAGLELSTLWAWLAAAAVAVCAGWIVVKWRWSSLTWG